MTPDLPVPEGMTAAACAAIIENADGTINLKQARALRARLTIAQTDIIAAKANWEHTTPLRVMCEYGVPSQEAAKSGQWLLIAKGVSDAAVRRRLEGHDDA